MTIAVYGIACAICYMLLLDSIGINIYVTLFISFILGLGMVWFANQLRKEEK